jgi:hypothetical protein
MHKLPEQSLQEEAGTFGDIYAEREHYDLRRRRR